MAPLVGEVKYQGRRQVKSSPLYQVEYSERFLNPLRVFIKCASNNRIAALIPHQSKALEDDFFQRAYPCQGTKCDWCKNKKNMGPSQYEYEGEVKTICWYSNPDIPELNAEAVDLIQQYALMHEELAPVG